MSEPRTAWFSEQAAQKFGTVWWLAEDGREVEITAVHDDYRWPDKTCVGKVLSYVRLGRAGAERMGYRRPTKDYRPPSPTEPAQSHPPAESPPPHQPA